MPPRSYVFGGELQPAIKSIPSSEMIMDFLITILVVILTFSSVPTSTFSLPTLYLSVLPDVVLPFTEKLKDPLVHIIRNSIDHGIEKPRERQILGKLSETN